jgi:hypothetical protein
METYLLTEKGRGNLSISSQNLSKSGFSLKAFFFLPEEDLFEAALLDFLPL